MRLQRQFGRAVVMIGGFGGSGAPIELIDRFAATGHPTGLTVVNNKAGNGHCGLREMLPSLTFQALQALTGARLHLTAPVTDLTVPERAL